MNTWSEVAGLEVLKIQKVMDSSIEDFEASKELIETYTEFSHIVFSSKEDLELDKTIV